MHRTTSQPATLAALTLTPTVNINIFSAQLVTAQGVSFIPIVVAHVCSPLYPVSIFLNNLADYGHLGAGTLANKKWRTR